MNISIEHLQLSELVKFLREQANDAFPGLKDEKRLNMLAEKWHKYAEFCTCRNETGQLVGMIAFYANQPSEGVVYIPHIYVSCEYRGRKVFTSMLRVIEKYVKDSEFRFIRLEVQKSNKNAQKAYSHYGFSYLGAASEESLYMQYNIA